jgi:broad specificity phosphatase PhoE
VDRSGRPIHPFRFQAAEPFYNGVALCRGLDGQQVRLRLNGTWTRVADDIEPVPLDEVRRFAEGSGRVGLFVRHAERAAITPATPNWGNDVLLTARGVADAEALGQKLAGVSRLALWSSPVERCRQTAEAVARGADIMADRVEAHTHLGNPGIYFDPTSRPPDLLRTDFHAFADAYLDTGVAEGMRPVPEASEELLAFLEQKMADADCTVFVTHDFFAAALMSYLGLKAPHRDDWCGYLEGVCILKDCGGRARFRRILGQTEERQC